MTFDAVIFDLDGTLIDSIPLYEEAFLYMISSADSSMSSEEFREIYIHNAHLSDALAQVDLEKREAELRKVRDEYYVKILEKKVEWFPDAKKLLGALPEDQAAAMMTGSWKSYVDAIEKRLPLSKYFQTIVTSDDFAPQYKPDPKGLFMVAEKLDVDPKECLYVGDQSFDIDAAKNAGMTSCFVKRPIYSPKELVNQADQVVESLEELIGKLSVPNIT